MIYLDNAASVPITSDILDLFKQNTINCFANQEAIHSEAYNVRNLLKKAEKKLSSYVSEENDNIKVQWGASGTDCLNLTLRHPFKGNIITTSVEHSALNEAITRKNNCEVRKVRISQNGIIDLNHLNELIDAKTSLLAIHQIHSETGVIQPLCEVRKIMDRHNSKAKFLVDTIQSAGKINIPFDDAKIDFAYIAAHKIGAPAGGLIIYRDTDNFAQFFNDLRTKEHSIGRAEPSLELTLIEKFIQTCDNSNLLYKKISTYNEQLREELINIKLFKDKIFFPVPNHLASPFILNFIVPNYQAGVLLRMCSDQNIMISSGSACEAETNKPSKVLTAMGYNKQLAFASLRLSMWEETTQDNINNFITIFNNIIKNY